MSEPRTPGSASDDQAVDPDDLAVAAYVDGEASPEQVARVESDVRLVARAQRYRTIVDEVREVPPAPSGALDAHVAAALGAFPAGATSDGVAAADHGTLVDLGARRARWRRLPPAAIAAAAAVLLVLVGVVGLVRSSGDDATDTAARAAEVTTTSVADLGRAGADAAPRPDGIGIPDAEALAGGRPAFGDVGELDAYLRELTAPEVATDDAGAQEQADATAGGSASSTGADGEAAPPTTTAPPVDPCGAVGVAGLDPTSVVAILPATVDGRPVTALVHEADGGRRLVVVDDETCTISVDQPL